MARKRSKQEVLNDCPICGLHDATTQCDPADLVRIDRAHQRAALDEDGLDSEPDDSNWNARLAVGMGLLHFNEQEPRSQ